MKFKETFKSILSTVLALTFILSAVPITTTFAAQSNEYVDPADVWMSANGRTNEFDMNATITYETQYCREDLYDFTNGLNDLSYPSFDLYCGLADYLHLSVDEMIGLNNKKTEENNRVKEFQELFSNLTAEQQAIVIAQIKGILSSKE